MVEARSLTVSRVEGLRRTWKASGLPVVLPIYLAVRLLLALWMFLMRQVFPQPLLPDLVSRPYLGVEIETNPWLEPWQRWDTLHYQAIAERGYAAFDSTLFVPPLYPWLIRLLSQGLGTSTLVSGLVISNAAYLAGMTAFYKLALDELKDSALAKRATVYLAVFPTAFYFLAAYTEPLFLLGTTGALLAARKGRWWLSGLAAGVVSVSRLIGAFFVIPVGYTAASAWRVTRDLRPWLAVAGSLIGAAVFPLFLWLRLDLSPLSPISALSARFHGGLAIPGLNLLEAGRRLLAGQALFADAFDLAFMLVFLACAVPVWKRLSRPLAVYYSTFLLLYLSAKAVPQPLLGSARYVVVLFPGFLVLALWGTQPWAHRLILYLSLVGLLLLSGQFAIWGWVG